MLVEDASPWIISELKEIDVLPVDINIIIAEYTNTVDTKTSVETFLKSTFPENVVI